MDEPQIDSRFAEPSVLFFGIGAQKAGTSWLHSYLNKHPEACVPPGKELHYWTRMEKGTDFITERLRERVKAARKEKNPRAKQLRNRLKMLETKDEGHTLYADALFKRYDGQKAVGEITPDYAELSKETFAFISGLNPDTRFIFLMRDPIERLHSSMRKRLRGSGEGERDREIDDEQILLELKKVLSRKNPAALNRSRYDQTIERLEASVPSEKIGLFFYEDVFSKRNVDDICDFLSISRMPGDFDMQVNRGNPTGKEFDSAFRAVAMEYLKPTYDRMSERFGDRLPDAWKAQMEAVTA